MAADDQERPVAKHGQQPSAANDQRPMVFKLEALVRYAKANRPKHGGPKKPKGVKPEELVKKSSPP